MAYKRKTRKQKEAEYSQRYGHIPIDYRERLAWLYDELKITDSQASEILYTRLSMINSLQYYETRVILYEVPEGSPRPRMRIVNRKNLSNMAIANKDFVHVYSPVGYEDQTFMKRMITEEELLSLDGLVCTPCNIDISAYLKTPSYYNKKEIMLSEIGLIRPMQKPDWDNIEKKYSDMFNHNVWLDDEFVVDGSIHRYYSVLPRVEIRLMYLNMVYTYKQYSQIINRKDYDDSYGLSYYGMESEM